MGLAQESGLLLITQASTLGLPKLAKVAHIIQGRDWLTTNELPCEIEHREFQFHNVFICPVSKEISGRDNPPMLLQCGHVISKQSLGRLARQAGRDGKFKCHTCPATMTMDKVVEIKGIM